MKLTSVTSIGAVVVGLVALGVGGYNLITTGCPLGSCSTPVATAVSTSDDHACALGCGHDHDAPAVSAGAVSEKKESCCHGDKSACTSECASECTEKKAGCCANKTDKQAEPAVQPANDPKSPA